MVQDESGRGRTSTKANLLVGSIVAAERLAVSWPRLADAYMGEHWLSSFAPLAIDEV